MSKYIPTYRIIKVILCCHTFVKPWKMISGEETEIQILSLGQQKCQNPALSLANKSQPKQNSTQVKVV